MFFTPPVRALVPTTLPTPHPGNALFRHYGARRRGVNVFVYDGLVTETEIDGVVPDRTYHGGHIHEIDSSEAVLLISAGYGDNITGGDVGDPAAQYDSALYNYAVYG